MEKLIGLAGTNGSGKDTVGHMLAERYSFLFISVTDLLRNEARARNLPIEREVLRTISAEWRREKGLGVLVDKALEVHQSATKHPKGLAIASLRNPGEADRVHELGGKVVWVDAKSRVRYERIQANAANRGREKEDNKTYEQFIAEEAAEMTSSGDSATLDMLSVKQKADIFLDNSTNDVEAFKRQAAAALSLPRK